MYPTYRPALLQSHPSSFQLVMRLVLIHASISVQILFWAFHWDHWVVLEQLTGLLVSKLGPLRKSCPAFLLQRVPEVLFCQLCYWGHIQGLMALCNGNGMGNGWFKHTPIIICASHKIYLDLIKVAAAAYFPKPSTLNRRRATKVWFVGPI